MSKPWAHYFRSLNNNSTVLYTLVRMMNPDAKERHISHDEFVIRFWAEMIAVLSVVAFITVYCIYVMDEIFS